MKIDVCHVIFETIQAAQMKVWIDSELVWIDSKRVREFSDMIHIWLIRFINIVNRFTSSQRLLWYDSDKSESIHV